MRINTAANALQSSPFALKVGATLIALVSLAGVVPLFAALAQPGIDTSGEITEDFNQGVVYKPDRLIRADGFHLVDTGWYLDSGASGSFVYRVPGRPGAKVGVNLWVYSHDGVTDSVSVSAPGLPLVELASNVDYLGTRLAVPPQYAAAASVDVQVDAHNAGPVEQLVIDQLVSYTITGTDPRAPPAYTFVAFGAMVALATFVLLRGRPHAGLTAIGIGLIASVAVASRVAALFLSHQPLDPDATVYKVYGEQFQWWPLFDHGIFSGSFSEREPLFPMVLHIYFQLLGSTDFTMRVVSTTLSIAVVILSMVAALRRLQTWWAPVLVGLLVAVSGPLIEESFRALRIELETLLILALYLALDRRPSRRPLLDAMVIGLIGAALALTRTYFIPVFVLAVALSFLIRYRSLRKVIALCGIAILIMGGAEAAHRVGLYEHKHNAFWDTGGYLRWSANQELFRFHRPLPHPELFPTLQQYQAEGTYAGLYLTSYQYFFEIHSPLEVARDSLAGTREMFDTLDSFTVDVGEAARLHAFPHRLVSLSSSVAERLDLLLRWTVLLGLMGMLVRSVREPRLLILPAIVLGWLGLMAFLFDHQILERYRHTWQMYPLALISGAWLLETVFLVIRRRAPWRHLTIEPVLFALALVLALAERVVPHSFELVDAVFVAAVVGALGYRRPAWGLAATLLTVSIAAAAVGAVVATGGLLGLVVRSRPQLRALVPFLALIPLAASAVLAGGRFMSGSIELVISMLAVTAAVAVAARQGEVRPAFIWLLSAAAPLAGLVYFLEPAAPFVVELAPVGVLAASWLYFQGHRWALVLGLVDAVLVVLIEPIAAWLGVAAGVTWLATGYVQLSSLRRRLTLAGVLAGGLALLTAGASLADTTPPASAAQTARLTTAKSSLDQRITVDRNGDTSLWIYAHRSSEFTEAKFPITVNGVEVTSDLSSYLLTDPIAWARVPLPAPPRVGDHLDVRIEAKGLPNPVDRYIEIGGVYATVDGIVSSGFNGTYLLVLGDDSLPRAPGGLPEPLVRNRLQPPMGEWMPGEVRGQADAREQANVLQIWQQTIRIAAAHPTGTGTGSLGTLLSNSQVGLGPGLSARNEYLQALAEWGVAGLIGLLLAIGAAAWLVSRSRDRFAAALLIAAAITMVGESILAEPASAIGLWLALGFSFGSSAWGAAFPSTSRASGAETPPTTSPPEAIRAG